MKGRFLYIVMERDGAKSPGGGPSPEPMDVGIRISHLRKERGWTLQEAAQKTKVSFSALSKIERNELSPTVTTLAKIAYGFGIGMSQLLEPPVPTIASARRSITRSGQGENAGTATCDNRVLNSDLFNRKMTPIHTKVRARDLGEYPEWAVYDAEVFLYVLKGVLVIHSENYTPTRLAAGDSIYYDASSGHLWVTEGEEDAEVLWVYADGAGGG